MRENPLRLTKVPIIINQLAFTLSFYCLGIFLPTDDTPTSIICTQLL